MSFVHKGRPSYGVAAEDVVLDVGSILDANARTLKDLLAGPGVAAARSALDSAPKIRIA
ncbi:MAG: hypothetical protein JO312_16230, partial [Hyphomicrobiales bacterium]|nr:hypothetical protein [Hyphomicrobiales bacterium]